ncbi:alpha/beta hydrolase [Deinococcus sp.]|uniref:alpha/beta hydrolase n=1 Tax=Deinococcus sp. TaxID=47478 RepID=UPI0025D04DC0|nr:alpha/beta hydrolase [Deinococcus sp.]
MSPSTSIPWSADFGGLALHGAQFPAHSERGAVLLCHGYAEHHGRYGRLIQALNGAGLSVYTYDQRGHGQSPGLRAVVDLNHLVEDHLKARAALSGLSVPVFAFGHSMGGLITATSALRDPRGLAGVILSSPALLVGEDEPALLKTLSGVLGKLLPRLPVTALASGGLSRIAGEVSAYDNDPQVYRGKVPALTAATMLRLSRAVMAGLPGWRLPTLLLHGGADTIADVRGSRRFAAEAGDAQTPRPTVEYLEVEGGYHELYNDTVQAEVTARTVSWLEGQIGGL